MAITKDFLADYGADNTGVASVTTKLYTNLKTDMQGQDVNLTFPAGTYNNATFGGDGGSWINGALDINVTATGATLTGSGGVFLSTSHLTQGGIDSASGKDARIQTVSPGATSVTLTAASASAGHISRFTVGNWMMIAGWDIQGGFQIGYSFPPNFQWSEFVKITSIVGNTIFFTGHPLRNFYDANWPETNRGTNFEVDAAGPATAFAINGNWGGTSTFTDGTYDNSNLINCYRENFIMNGGTSSSLPIYPSINKLYRAINHTAVNALTEMDKCSDTVEITGGTYSSLKAQSPCARICTISGATIGSMNGTPKNTVIDNCVITAGLKMAPISYGIGERIVVTNTSIGGALSGGLEDDGPTHAGWQDLLTMSGTGVLTVPRCYGTTFSRVVAPDAAGRNVAFWSANGGSIGSFKALSVVSSDPWPAVDDQSATTNITTTNGSQTFRVSSNLFVSGDIGKVIRVPGAGGSGGTLFGVIMTVSAFTGSTQDITVYTPAGTSLAAVSGTVQWGTCNYYVQTDQTSLPGSGLHGGQLRILAPVARSVYFNNCTGNDDILDLCQAGAQNKPWKSYTKRTYTGTNGGDLSPLGNLVSIKVNVIKAYTGVQSTLKANFSQFNNISCVIGGALSTFGPSINLKIAGERVMTLGSSTGIQTGDTGTTFSAPVFLRGGISWNMVLSATISGEDPSVWPQYTMELITDQGFPAEVPTAVAPLRLRLRAA